MATILVVDDETNIIKSFKSLLGSEHEVYGAVSGSEAHALIKERKIDLVFLDYNLAGEDGLQLLTEFESLEPDLYIVIISGYGNFEVIIQAMAMGAYDYLEKPLDIDKIHILLRRAIKSKKMDSTVKLLIEEQQSHFSLKRIVGKSLPMQNVFKQIGLLINTDVSVLISGENGTGKELIAKALHYSGKRREEPMVAVNCSGISETLLDNELFGHEQQAFTGADSMVKGKFEAAGEGTIMLDEIGDMPLALQVKLLRVLQEREFQRLGGNRTIKLKARIIAATNKDLQEKVRSGSFRQDLFYRINVAQIVVPPLRERKEDIPHLLYYFVTEANEKLNKQIEGASENTMHILEQYSWPGNIRELENTITNICINTHGPVIRSSSIPDYIRRPLPSEKDTDFIDHFLDEYLEYIGDHTPILPELIDKVESKLIKILGNRYGNNKSRMAAGLGISRVTLLKKLEKLKL